MRRTENVGFLPLTLLMVLGAACGDAKKSGGPTGGVGGGPTGGVSGGPTGGMGGGPGNLLCTDLLARSSPDAPGTPARCCPRPPPDCHDKPDGFTEPGEKGLCVDAEPGGSSYCSCGCSRGQWWCGC